jgi:hypothetical protein
LYSDEKDADALSVVADYTTFYAENSKDVEKVIDVCYEK